MSNESKLVVELWDFFRDQLPAGKRQAAAAHLLRLFEEYGFEIDREEVEDECEYLDEALEHLHDDDHSDDDNYNDEHDRD